MRQLFQKAISKTLSHERVKQSLILSLNKFPAVAPPSQMKCFDLSKLLLTQIWLAIASQLTVNPQIRAQVATVSYIVVSYIYVTFKPWRKIPLFSERQFTGQTSATG